MNRSFLVLEIIFLGMAGIFFLSAAFLRFLDSLKEKEKKKIQDWFIARWKTVEGSRLVDLPERVINWYLHFEMIVSRLSVKLNNLLDNKVLFWIALVGGMTFSCIYVLIKSKEGIISYGLFILFVCFLGYILIDILANLFSFVISKGIESRLYKFSSKVFQEIKSYLAAGVCTMYALYMTLLLIEINVYIATIMAFIVIPIYWYLLYRFPLWIEKIVDFIYIRILKELPGPTNFSLFFFGFSLSIAITLLGLSIGHFVTPNASLPRSLQIVISNMIFDGFTVLITFKILKWAIAKKSLLMIPIAICLDILCAGFLACCSIYFGLVKTENSLNLFEITNILIAKSPDGTYFELGPYFWIMHTTFIPTIIYLSIIFACWIGKISLVPVRWFFGVAQIHKHPLRLSSYLCALFSAIFFSMYQAVNFIEKNLINQNNEKEKSVNTLLIKDIEALSEGGLPEEVLKVLG